MGVLVYKRFSNTTKGFGHSGYEIAMRRSYMKVEIIITHLKYVQTSLTHFQKFCINWIVARIDNLISVEKKRK